MIEYYIGNIFRWNHFCINPKVAAILDFKMAAYKSLITDNSGYIPARDLVLVSRYTYLRSMNWMVPVRSWFDDAIVDFKMVTTKKRNWWLIYLVLCQLDTYYCAITQSCHLGLSRKVSHKILKWIEKTHSNSVGKWGEKVSSELNFKISSHSPR